EALLAAQREQELHEQEQAAQREQELLAQKQAAQEKQNSDFCQLIGEIALNSKLLSMNLKSQRLDKEKQVTKRRTHITESLRNFRIIHKKSSISLSNTSQISLVIAIAPVLPTEEHLSTIPETKSNKVIKSSVENLVPIPSESEGTSDNENTLIDSSPKFDYLLEELSGELAHIDPVPPGIKEADFDLEEEIRLVENLLYDNSSPRPPEELNTEIADTILESLSISYPR
nr:hypothetical protein [Tanacetum cinerariifolium]